MTLSTETAGPPGGPQPVLWTIARLQALGRVLSGPALSRAGLCLFAALVMAIAMLNVWKPAYNWDIAPYVAVAMDTGEHSVEALHTRTWQIVEDHTPPAQMYKLRAGNPYNAHQFDNPQSFYSQLPMYQVKVGYTAVLRHIGKYTDLVSATTLISVFSSILFGAVCLSWMAGHGFGQSAPIAGAVLVLAGYLNMAGMANPDMLVSALSLIGIYGLVKGRMLLALAFLFAAFLVRPDNIIFLCALALSGLLFGFEKRRLIGLFVVALACYFAITSNIDHPGWWSHFYFSNIELQNSMSGFNPEFSVADYIKGVVRGISVALRFNNWPMILFLIVCAILLLARHGRPLDRRAGVVMFALTLAVAAKFAVFPLPDDRVYFNLLAGLVLIVLEWWRPDFGAKTVVKPVE